MSASPHRMPTPPPGAAAPQGGRAPRTLADHLKTRRNNFDFIRLTAAFLVLYSHAFPLAGAREGFEPLAAATGWLTFGHLAVGVFFVISGMLVARSFLSEPKAGAFLKKRCLRIFPGLWACVFVCAFVIGPIFTNLPLSSYFAAHRPPSADPSEWASTWKFVLRNCLLLPGAYQLPGVFQSMSTHAQNSATNGSLWTLPLEFLMYLVVMGLGVARVLNRRAVGLLLVASVAGVVFNALYPDWPHDLLIGAPRLAAGLPAGLRGAFLGAVKFFYSQKEGITFLPRFAAAFLLGTLMLLYKEGITLDWKIALLLAAACVASHARVYEEGVFLYPLWVRELVFTVALPYVVMWLAFLPLPGLSLATRWGDFSYGVYLYAFPVQQITYELAAGRIPWWSTVVIASAGTLVLAAASWFLVEKPFLRLKGKPLHKPAGDHAPRAAALSPAPVMPPPPAAAPRVVEKVA